MTINTRSTIAEIRAALAEANIAAPAKARKQELLDLLHPETALDLTGSYEVALVNMTDGSVQGHIAGCKDLGRKQRGKVQFAEEPWVFGVLNKEDARANYNADFDQATDGWHEITWLPCADQVPAGAESAPLAAGEPVAADSPAEAVEQPEKVADAIKDWRGNYNTVFAPAAETISSAVDGVEAWTVNVSAMLRQTHLAGPGASGVTASLAETEAQAVAALKTWQRTLDRKDATDMEKYNQNRSFLAGYLGAVVREVTSAKKMPVVAFAKDMDRALRPEALKAGAAAWKAEVSA